MKSTTYSPIPKRVKQNFLRQNMNHLREVHRFFQKEEVSSKSQIIKPINDVIVPPKVNSSNNLKKKIIDRRIQTEKPEEVPKLYETRILKFISPLVAKDRGDHDSSKNIKANEYKNKKSDVLQKGTLPKTFLNEKKLEIENKKNVPELMLLSDDEIREYLRVTRENYAPIIKRCNLMFLSNNTLEKTKESE